MPKYATKEERVAKTLAWLSQKIHADVPECETCRWYHTDKDHCNQYASAGAHWMCLNVRESKVRARQAAQADQADSPKETA